MGSAQLDGAVLLEATRAATATLKARAELQMGSARRRQHQRRRRRHLLPVVHRATGFALLDGAALSGATRAATITHRVQAALQTASAQRRRRRRRHRYRHLHLRRLQRRALTQSTAVLWGLPLIRVKLCRPALDTLRVNATRVTPQWRAQTGRDIDARRTLPRFLTQFLPRLLPRFIRLPLPPVSRERPT